MAQFLARKIMFGLCCPGVWAQGSENHPQGNADKGALASHAVAGAPSPKNDKGVSNALKVAISVWEKNIKTGSSSALNQIAAAYYTLGETAEKQNKNAPEVQECFQKAAKYFCEAADAGCKEARYNAGLAYSKLQSYANAAHHYRVCIKEDNAKEEDLLLKSAVNLALLVLDKKIQPDVGEIQSWIALGNEYPQHKKSADLVQTAVVILTELSAPEGENNAEEKKNTETKAAVTKATVTQLGMTLP
ncbi:hypothetical protein AGMMS49949_08530 [Alphaproteobacteria bacterium]|nr:hypothetical protein AGMMS49949_08530 [Alphaproteobacteria bacterium]GHS99555.1 hypothetical protein AGMMS50296_7750 [Alphaproteobacteria bacterium]